MLYENFIMEINNNELKVVAFDCFDTIIHRDCHPETILYIWARNVCAKIKFIISPKELYKIRKQSERNLRNLLGVDEVSYKELIRGIYDCLDSNNKEKLEIGFDMFFNISYSIEKKIELNHIKLDKEGIDLIKSYRKQMKKIIIISDFYLDKTFFIDMFSKLDILEFIDEIYISSEIGKRKSTGNLYHHVLKCLDIQPYEMLMVGDNKKSDIDIPRDIGIMTSYKYYNNTKSMVSLKQIKRKIRGICCNVKIDNAFDGFTPIILLFIAKLYEALIKENCKNVLFCSREGQKLKVLFDEYQRIFFGYQKIQSQYFYVSRRSTLIPSLRDVDTEDFHYIFRQYKILRLRDFLLSIGFEKDEIEKIRKLTVCDLDQNISSPKEDPFLKSFISNSNFIDIYNKKRAIQKKLIKQYVRQFGINPDNDTIYMVDIGWKGTIQDNLFNIFDKNTNIHGYYFGLFNNDKSEKNMKDGIIFSQDTESNNYSILSNNYVEFERIFAANHGPTLSYINLGKEVIPKLSDDMKDIEIYEYVKFLQDSMIESFINLSETMSLSPILPTDIENILVKYHLRHLCINMPRQSSIFLESRTKYKENFGNISGIKDKTKVKVIQEHLERGKFLFVDYSYRVLDRCNLKILYPIAGLYCRLVYALKLLTIK